jgi:hypothetical protein
MQKKIVAIWLIAIAIIAIVGCILTSGCTSSKNDAWEYFPMDIGTEWHYNIFIENDNPVGQEKVIWPKGNGYSTSYISKSSYYRKAGESCKLIMKVDERLPESSDGAIVKIIEDEIGLYNRAEEIRWTPIGKENDEIAINQKLIYNGVYGPYPSSINGYSDRPIFFIDNPNNEIVTLNNLDEILIFIEVSNDVSGYIGQPCIHLMRQVSSRLSEHYSKEFFTEDMWFAKGKGLVRLEQKIEGQKSMTWTLEKFIPGKKA